MLGVSTSFNKHILLSIACQAQNYILEHHVAKKKNPAAVALARQRMEKMSPHERSAIAGLGGLARAASLDKDELAAIARKAGKVGGQARARALTKEQRQEIARKAAAARWGKKQ
jgi:hypothetical protein